MLGTRGCGWSSRYGVSRRVGLEVVASRVEVGVGKICHRRRKVDNRLTTWNIQAALLFSSLPSLPSTTYYNHLNLNEKPKTKKT